MGVIYTQGGYSQRGHIIHREGQVCADRGAYPKLHYFEYQRHVIALADLSHQVSHDVPLIGVKENDK